MASTHFAETGFVAAGTGNLTLCNAGRFASQQLTQGGRSGLMHRGPQGHFDGFEVQLTGLATVLKNDAEQSAYFALDFLPDCFRRFFS
ncbi:MAG: hypothetical protein M3Y27_09925 [Acidobacteriota bacterium]|nr:hypothetical protein [Acidobacteriota bacterium]